MAGVLPFLLLLITLGNADIDRALAIARSSEGERARFHAPYVIAMNDPAVEQIEVITEFRRVELIAEDHLRKGDWMFTQSVQSAVAAAVPWRGRVAILARVRFHPLNTYVMPPRLDVRIAALDAKAGTPSGLSGVLEPLDAQSTTLYATVPNKTQPQPLTGEIVEALFDAARLTEARTVIVLLEGNELARKAIDFSRLE